MKIHENMSLEELKKITRRKNISEDALELLRDSLVDSRFSDTNEMSREEISIESGYAIARMDFS